jgi:hypothetical protein
MSVIAIPIFMLMFGLLLFGVITGVGASRARAANPMYRRGSGAVIGVGIAVAGLFAVMFLYLLASQRTVVRAPAVAQVQPAPAPAPVVAYGWNRAMTREPAAPRDLHTSMKTLKAYMAATVESASLRVGEGARKVWVYADKQVPPELVTEIRRETKAQVLKSETDATKADFVVRLRWEDGPHTNSVPWWPQPMRRGTIVADATGPRGEEAVRARLDEKPWLERPPASYGRRGYMVVTSGEAPAASPDAAVDQMNRAKRVAVSQLVEAQVATLSSRWATSSDDIRAQVEARFGEARTPFEDEILTRVDLPLTGPVWYAAGLMRVPADDVVHMAESAHTVSNDRRAGWARMIGGAAGMLLVLLALYALINAITRGYFRGHLRAAVAIVLAVAVVMMFLGMA